MTKCNFLKGRHSCDGGQKIKKGLLLFGMNNVSTSRGNLTSSKIYISKMGKC
jgi:hypothetical protein